MDADAIVPPAEPGPAVAYAYQALLDAVNAQQPLAADRASLFHAAVVRLTEQRDENLAEALLTAPGGPKAIAARTGLPISVVLQGARRLPPQED